MKLEIDIPSILYQDAKENRNYISLTKLEIAWKAIADGKPLDQEPKTGHWIPTYGNVKCSVCGSVKDSREVGKATHYCDFCGARMVEPQEGEKI